MISPTPTIRGVTPPSPPEPAAVGVVWSNRTMTVRDARLFGTGGGELSRSFLSRVLALAEVLSVTIDRARGQAVVRFTSGQTPALTRRLGAALRGELPTLGPTDLPRLFPNGTLTLFRHGPFASTWEVRLDRPGTLRIRHRGLKIDSPRARRVEADLARVHGVTSARFDPWAGGLLIRYDPGAVDGTLLLRGAEAALALPVPPTAEVEGEAPVRFGMVNANLGMALATDLALPLLAPVTAVMMVGSNLGTLREATAQVRRGEVGVPVLYTTIMAVTLVSGQFAASALMAWSFRYWTQRTRRELTRERFRLLNEWRPPLPGQCRVSREGDEVPTPSARLRSGDVVALGAGDLVPADGCVLRGAGVVDERSLAWGEGVAARNPGDRVQAGSSVFSGRLLVAVEQPWASSRAAALGRALEAATRPDRSPAPGDFASRAVGPTLATAGVGLLLGGLGTAAAVLRPDYATGPGLAGRLGLLRDVAAGLRKGLLVRDPRALRKVREVGLIVLDDGPHLRRQGLELSLIQTPMHETDDLLRYTAAVARHLADDRASALSEACRARSLPQLRLDLEADADGLEDAPHALTVRHGRRRVRLVDMPPDGDPAPPLAVEIDGAPAGVFRFRRARRPEAAGAVERLRELTKAPVVLLSDRPERDVASLARSLGIEAFAAGLDEAGKGLYLAEGARRGARVAWVGDGRAYPSLAKGCHLAVSVSGDARPEADPAAVQLLTSRLAPLADLWAIAEAHAGRLREARLLAVAPNLLCVAGAFTLGFSSLAAVVLSNLGTLGIYNRSAGALRAVCPPTLARTGPKPSGIPGPHSTPTPETGASRAQRPA